MNQTRRSKNNAPEISVTKVQAPSTKNNTHRQNNRDTSNVKTTHFRRPNRSGVVGSKQLESIHSLLQRNNETASKEPTLSQLSTKSKQLARIPLSDDDIIQSVMQQVAELNQDKLPEASLVKVLTDVYLDTKSKLKKIPEQHHVVSTSDDVVPCSAAKPEPSVSEPSVPAGSTTTVVQPAPLSVAEKKRLKWEQEKAELAALAAQTPWGSSTIYSSTTRPSRPSQPLPTTDFNHLRPSVPLIENPRDSHSFLNNPSTGNRVTSSSATGTAVPALTPSAFAAHQDAEQLKREEQRRQWKNALDEQIKEQRLLREKQLLEERQKHLALLSQLQTGTGLEPRTCMATTAQASPNINPLPNIATAPLLQSHPSASHFSASIPIPDLMCPDPGVAAVKPPSQFNRTRGFTQSLYSSPADEAARLRRAEEIQRANLEQIEEHRRLRELERANKLLEDKLEEERLERERARLQAIAEAENREKHLREMEETTREQFMFDNLKQAREEAASYRTQVRFRRSSDHPNQPCSTTNAEVNQTTVPQQRSLTPNAQVNLGKTYTVNLDNLANIQVPLVTSSVGDCEDAACQTDPVSIISPNRSPPQAKSSGDTGTTHETHYPVIGQTRRKIANTNNNVVDSSRRQPPSKRTPGPQSKVGGNRRTPESSGGSRTDRPLPKSDRLRASNTNDTGFASQRTNAELAADQGPNKSQLSKQTNSEPSSIVTKTGISVSTTMSGRNPTRIPVPVSSRTQKPVIRPVDPSPPPITRYTDDLPVTHYPTDLVRTQDILAPIDGDVAVPRSRVNTAKQATQQPYPLDHVPDPPKSQREHTTQRQSSILQHLSEIRKSLQMRQMLYESGTFDDDDDVYGAEFGE